MTRVGRLLLLVLLVAVTLSSAAQDVAIKKYTNGFDANTAPGPLVTVGSTVTWTYVVTNTGAREITNIAVTDDQGVTVTCPATTLDAGLDMTCTASGTAIAGQYTNIGTVNGTLPDSSPVSASDPSHYFGETAPTLTFEKRTNGFDADTPPGPIVPGGSTVTWTYVITNVGSEELQNIAVTDDQGVTVTCPATTLAVGATMTCTGSGIAQLGQYSNTGTVTAQLATSLTNVSASDPSHYYGQSLRIDKFTNGLDVTPPGPRYTEGTPITWTYVIENPGPANVTNVSVSDDQGVVVTCPSTTLNAGATMTCSGSGTAQPGLYTNVGTVSAQLPAGGLISVSDSSYYLGDLITVKKYTNGIDADTAPGPNVAVGSTVNWTYVVTNLADETLTDISVTDDQGVTVTCPATTLATLESMTCTASGTAILGQYANVGTVNATSVTYGAFTDSDPSHYFGIVPAPAITATKTEALSGNTIHYVVTIANNGTGDASDVVFSDTVDPNTTIVTSSVTATSGSITATATNVTVNIGTMTPSSTVTIEFDVTITGSTTSISNTGSVSGSNFTTVQTNTATTSLAPAIGATKSASLVDGDTIHYVVVITNNGNGTASDVVFTDTLDANTTLVSGSVTTTQGSITSTPTNVTVNIGSIAPAGSVTIAFDVNVTTPTNTVSNTGSVSGSNFTTVQTNTATTSLNAAITATKTASLVDSDTIHYTIVVTNSGNAPASSVVLNDPLDPNTQLVSGSVTTTQGSITSSPSNVTVNIGTINPSSSVTIAFDVNVTNPTATSIANQASVSGANFTTTTSNTTNTPFAAALAAPVPTLSEWALMAMLALLAMLAMKALR